MRYSKLKLLLIILFTGLGVFMISPPLYADIFTRVSVEHEGPPPDPDEIESDDEIAIYATYSETTLFVPPLIPFAGGIITFIGGYFLGRGKSI